MGKTSLQLALELEEIFLKSITRNRAESRTQVSLAPVLVSESLTHTPSRISLSWAQNQAISGKVPNPNHHTSAGIWVLFSTLPFQNCVDLNTQLIENSVSFSVKWSRSLTGQTFYNSECEEKYWKVARIIHRIPGHFHLNSLNVNILLYPLYHFF